VNSLQQFRIITNDIKDVKDLSVTITSPSGNRLKAHIVNTADGFLVNFSPTQIGEYLLFVTFCGTPLLTEPYLLKCLKESDPSRVFAMGPGLHSGIVNEPAEFKIDTRAAGHGALGVTVEGPCECVLNCRDLGNGTCDITYWPTEIGDYTVNITFNNQHIQGSPFQPIIFPTPNIERVKVSGAGIELHGKLFTRTFWCDFEWRVELSMSIPRLTRHCGCITSLRDDFLLFPLCCFSFFGFRFCRFLLSF
jgi:filamin